MGFKLWTPDAPRAPMLSQARPHVQHGVDDDERQALQAEGLGPDDPAVVAALDPVRWELSLLMGDDGQHG
jgi:hypothetical protein